MKTRWMGAPRERRTGACEPHRQRVEHERGGGKSRDPNRELPEPLACPQAPACRPRVERQE